MKVKHPSIFLTLINNLEKKKDKKKKAARDNFFDDDEGDDTCLSYQIWKRKKMK